VELRADGSRVVFHRSGRKAWTHPDGDPYMIDSTEKEERRQPCPTCSRTLTTRPKTSPPS
jgi:hypothetical protein